MHRRDVKHGCTIGVDSAMHVHRSVLSSRMPARSSASRRARTAICISATRCRRSSISTWRARRAGGSCCASRTSTRRAAGRNTKRRSTRISPGSASPGKSRCGASPSISTTIARRSARLDGKGLVYPSFESRAEIARWSRERERRAPGRAIPTARRFIPATCRRWRPPSAAGAAPAGEPYALRLDMARGDRAPAG